MATGWFRIPENETDGTGPKYISGSGPQISGIDRYDCNRVGQSPDQFIAWVEGTNAAINTLESKQDVDQINENGARQIAQNTPWINPDSVGGSFGN